MTTRLKSYTLELVLLIILLNLTVNQPSPVASEAFIKIRQFQVPPKVRLGEQSVRLNCDYELGVGENLHAMKLFKDDQEFYRYTPARNHQDQRMVFNVAGCPIDLTRSDAFGATISRMERRSAGRYKCQVTVEGTFRSISQERSLEVMEQTGQRARPLPGQLGGEFSGAVSGRQRPKPAGRSGPTQVRHTELNKDPNQQHYLASSSINDRPAGSNSGRLGANLPVWSLLRLAALLCSVWVVLRTRVS